jgi:4'-phosphopantetheinyl transferase
LNTIYPVILAVPYEKKNLSAKDRVAFLSSHARDALEISARKSGVFLSDLLKDKNGAPVPCKGNYWSLSHKPSYVAAVVAAEKTGIDIEEIKTCSESLFKKAADQSEWELAEGDKFRNFFRYWTAKESVLKAAGTGLKHLSKCRITQIVDENSLAIDYMNKIWLVEHLFFNRHIASVVKGPFNIKWTVLSNR